MITRHNRSVREALTIDRCSIMSKEHCRTSVSLVTTNSTANSVIDAKARAKILPPRRLSIDVSIVTVVAKRVVVPPRLSTDKWKAVRHQADGDELLLWGNFGAESFRICVCVYFCCHSTSRNFACRYFEFEVAAGDQADFIEWGIRVVGLPASEDSNVVRGRERRIRAHAAIISQSCTVEAELDDVRSTSCILLQRLNPADTYRQHTSLWMLVCLQHSVRVLVGVEVTGSTRAVEVGVGREWCDGMSQQLEHSTFAVGSARDDPIHVGSDR